MYEYTLNLDDYLKSKETNSCYLDGRYFQKALLNYPGLLPDMNIRIRETKRQKKELRFNVDMKQNRADPSYPGILRVVIETPNSRHSNLLILDYENGIAHRFEPLGKKGPYFEKINEIIEYYLSHFMDFEVMNINTSPLEEINGKCARKQQRSGFCNAYVLLYAYNFLNGQEFNPSHILRFAKKVETEYGTLPKGEEDIEFGLFGNPNPNQGRNVLIGGGLGALSGGLLVGGAGGIIGGGLLGAGVGALI